MAKKIIKKARHSCECIRCGEQILSGTYITPITSKSGMRRWVCTDCEFPEGYGLSYDGWSRVKISDTDKHLDVSLSVIQQDELTQPQAVDHGAVRDMVKEVLNNQLPIMSTSIKGEVFQELSDISRLHLREELEGGLAEIIDIVRQRVNDEIKRIPNKVIEVHYDDETVAEISGEVLHEKFQEVIDLVTAVPREPVFLTGPTGSGKTFLSRQVAKVLDCNFGMISCSAMMSEAQLLGRAIPNLTTGETTYQSTEFVEIFENGGVFLFDEVDAADSNTLLVLNSALSNGVLAIPNRTDKPYAEQHPDFVCLCAANTFGSGADRMYVGRNQLDMAFLDRFRIGIVEVDYSEAIELVKCPMPELYDMLIGWRNKINEHGLRRAMSTRFLEKAYKMVSQKNWDFDKVTDAFFSGWSEDEKDLVLG